ncbi:MAG: B12-binding domain-containing radical SAM protein [bacterium]
MKIRLIQPAQLDEYGNTIKYKKLFMPSLTLPTVAALTPKGIDVGITEDYVEDIDFDEDIDLVGITALTCQAPRAYQIAEEFKKRGKKTIMGGIHASFCMEEALRHVDSVLVGEAENLWQRVIEDIKNRDLKRVYKASQNPDLSRSAIPRYDLLDFKNYVIPPFSKTPQIAVQTARGCPHCCDFCSVHPFLGRTIRKKNIRHVVREIEAISPSLVFFSDDNIGADPKHAKELFEAIVPLKIRWACQMDTTIIRYPELIELAAKAGCHETFIGVESLNDDSLHTINKGFNKVSEYKELFRLLKDVGILGQASLVFGLDGDTRNNLEHTIDTVLDWDIKFLYIFILVPLPGTKIYGQMKEEKRIVSHDWSLYDALHATVRNKCLSTDELTAIIWKSYRKFYSVTNILRRIWRFKKQYILFFPRDLAVEDIFFSFCIRKSVKKGMHPFTLGLG